jgi:hypothetical protein
LDSSVHLLFFIAFAVLAIVALVFGHLAAKRRREAMRAWAQTRGHQFSQLKDRTLDNRFPAFGQLRKGDNRYGYNIVSGQIAAERDLLAFDYHYETHSTDSKGRRQTHHHHFSAVILETGLPMQHLFIRPENFFDKVTEFFGVDDIDFESSEFSRKFHVKASSKKWAFDVIHARTIEFLLGHPEFTLEFDTRHAIAYRGKRLAPQDLDQAIAAIQGILDRLPDYVVKQQCEMMTSTGAR